MLLTSSNILSYIIDEYDFQDKHSVYVSYVKFMFLGNHLYN